MQNIAEEELIQAILEATVQSDGNPHRALRTAEMVERSGRSSKWVLEQLRKLKQAGELGCTKVRVEGIDGSWSPRPAYYLLKKKDNS